MRKIPVLGSLSPSDAQSLNLWGAELLAELDRLRRKAPLIAEYLEPANDSSNRTFYDLTDNLTLDEGALNKTHYINCTVASKNIVLPSASPGKWLKLVNIGTETFTVNTTICSVPTRSRVDLEAFTNTSYVAAWPTAVPVLSESGVVTAVSAGGIAIKDASNHYWIITIGTDGAITTTDNGVVPPV